MFLPDSWLAMRRKVRDGKRGARANGMPVSHLFPKGFLTVKFSAYFSKGSSKDSIFPSSQSLYNIRVGKIFDRLAIL